MYSRQSFQLVNTAHTCVVLTPQSMHVAYINKLWRSSPVTSRSDRLVLLDKVASVGLLPAGVNWGAHGGPNAYTLLLWPK